MRDYSSGQIRNVLLAGHGGCGKTTLAEALLYKTGAIDRAGRVEDGNTVMDFDDEETERGFSVSLATAPLEWNSVKVNLLDSPGYADFIGEVQAGLTVCDLVCLVVSAVDGVEVQHEIIWRLADSMDLPRVIFVNKCDKDRADIAGTIESLRNAFGGTVAPIHIPIGQGGDFRGLVALLSGRAITYDAGVASEGDIPAELAEAAESARKQSIEAIVETDDTLMERYFADEEISFKELLETLGKGVAVGDTYPVLIGSATSSIGLDRLLDFLEIAAPSPLDREGMQVRIAGGESAPITTAGGGSPAAYVYKTYADPFVGQISYMRVARGELRPDIHLEDTRTGHNERLHQILALSGKRHSPVARLAYGDLGAVPKLGDVRTGDTLAEKGDPITVVVSNRLEPVYARAIAAKDKGEEDKLANALSRLTDEDPTIRIERNAETHQTLLHGMGETHIGITLERMKRKFGVDVHTFDPRVAYRETATKPSDFKGKHKKQSGGRGQYGVAHLRLEPLPRGSGYEFVDEVRGGAIPRGFIPAVDKGVRESMERGPIAGYPVVDVRIIVDDGKAHSVDSDEFSFKMAGSLGLRGALAAAEPTLLEPIGAVEILIPDELAGDVSGDLNSRRGRLSAMEPIAGGRQLVKAMVPMAEMTRYAIDLRSITGGRGAFSLEFDHYAELPPHLQDKVIAEATAKNT